MSKKNAILDTAEKLHLAAGQAGPLVTSASTPNLRMLSRVLDRFLDAYGYINILCSIYVSKKNAILDTAEKSHLAAGLPGPFLTTASTPNLRMLSRVLDRFLDAYGYINILCSIYVSKKNAILDTVEKSDLKVLTVPCHVSTY